MPISQLVLEVFEYRQPLSPYTVALTRDKFTQAVLRPQIDTWLQTPARRRRISVGSPTSPLSLQAFIDEYSETVVADPVADLEKFYATVGFGFTPRGVPTGFPPLAYAPRNIRMSTASLGALGEGIGGLYLEVIEGLNVICRPILVSPDLILENPVTGQLASAEIKTTQGPSILTYMKNAAITLLDVLAKNKLIRPSKYVSYTVGVVIRDLNFDTLTCELHSLRMEEV